jgi:hypothetical protein
VRESRSCWHLEHVHWTSVPALSLLTLLVAITPLLLLLLLLVVPLLLLVEPLLAVPCLLLPTANTSSSSIAPKAATVAARDVDIALIALIALVASTCPPALLLLLLLGLLGRLMARQAQPGKHTPTAAATTSAPTPANSGSSRCPCVKGSIEAGFLCIAIHPRQNLLLLRLLLGLQLCSGQAGTPTPTIPSRP